MIISTSQDEETQFGVIDQNHVSQVTQTTCVGVSTQGALNPESLLCPAHDSQYILNILRKRRCRLLLNWIVF